MKVFPKISIITPSFNQGEFLEATIQSVLSQNYPNLEYIIIDGGSTDGSVEIIKKYEKHLAYWCSEPDAGQYQAIQKGFDKSTGDIMAWLNSDDMYYPWTLKTVASIMTELPEVQWLTTLNAGWWDFHGFNTGFTQLPGFSREAFLDGSYIPWSKHQLGWIQQESTFWKRSLWDKSGATINLQYKLAGDFDLWGRFYQFEELYGTVSALGGFRSQNKQKSGQKEKYKVEALQSLNEFRKTINWKPKKTRDIAKEMKLKKMPKLNQLVLSKFGYKGKKIYRADQDSINGKWKIEDYKFF